MGDGPQTRIHRALKVAYDYGQTDGDQHKAWVIDQMVRALTGVDYEVWRAAYEASGDEWSEGVAP